MNNRPFLALFALLLLTSSAPAQGKIPPDRDGLLAGEGMGLASVAEKNGFPGPKHVLDLVVELKLTSEQSEAARKLMENVGVSAKALGSEIVRKEEELNALFKSDSLSPQSLESKLREIGKLRADLRGIHLQAHLRMKWVLRPEQTELYSKLRGYEIKH